MAGLLEKIKQGETPWRKPYQEGEKYAGIALPRNPSSKHIYSGVNAMALRFAQEENGYSDPRWMTYNQASAMGGQVRKGEKGTFILVPMRITQQDEKDPTKKRSFTMFKATAVFNAEQIDGLNLPELSTESLPKMTPLDAQEFIVERYKKAMAARTGKAPNIKHTYVGSGGAHQAPNWGTLSDEVTLPNLEQFNSPEDLFDTIAHELVHSTGHPDRLDRSDLTKDYANDLESRAKEELIAEIGGALLANMFGVDATFDNSAAYVQSWLKHLQSNPDEIINATSQAQKAVDYILGTDLGDWSPIDGYSIGNAVQKPTKEEES
jgi:antirestriction protein ArdC